MEHEQREDCEANLPHLDNRVIAVEPDDAACREEGQGVEDGEDNVANAIAVKVIIHGPVVAIGIKGYHDGCVTIDAVP